MTTTITSRRAMLGGMTLAGIAASTIATKASAGTRAITHSGPSIPLWPGQAPGAPTTLPTRAFEQRSTDTSFDDRWLTGIASPRSRSAARLSGWLGGADHARRRLWLPVHRQ
jgi:hypothetical protein